MFKLTLVILIFSISSTSVLSNPCPTEILPQIAPIEPTLLLRQILMNAKIKDHNNEPIEFSADDITIENGVITMTEPRFNGRRISYNEFFCTSFGTSLFGNEICLQSDTRSIEGSLCQTLGLEPVGGEPILTTSRADRVIFFYNDNKWQPSNTQIIGNNNYQFQALFRFSCRL